MKKLSKTLTCIFLCSTISSLVFADNAPSADERFFYLGTEFGVVDPVQHKFKHKSSKTDITLKKSSMYSGKIGYSFYPQMSIEFSGTYQPKYRLGYVLPATGSIPKTSGVTKVSSDVYMMNLVYDLKTYNGFTPFIIGGAGIARVKVKPTSSSFMGMEFFRIKKTNTNCMAWQIGIGVSKEIVNNFTIDLAAKLQVAHNLKVNYDKLINPVSMKYGPSETIKKTIGVGEFGIGFTYKLPI